MNSYECFKIYKSIKLHFNTKQFDIRKYGFSSNKFTIKEFENRNDYILFKRISKKYNKIDFIILTSSNFLYDKETHISELFDESSQNNYKRAKKVLKSLEYFILEDIKKIISGIGFKEIFNYEENEIPYIFKLMISGEIHPETIIILDKIFDLINILDTKIKQKDKLLLWDNIVDRLTNYKPFVKIESLDILDSIKQQTKTLIQQTKTN